MGGLPFAGLAKGGSPLLFTLMPTNLRRVTGHGDFHFITFCCYQRRALLASPQARNFAVQILAEVRAKYGFALLGYVIMPEHVHFLIGESPTLFPAAVVQVFKQRVSRTMRAQSTNGNAQLRQFWQRRYYDFNVYKREKVKEKLQYMHANPVAEKLVAHPRDWPWSSWSFYATGKGLLKMNAI